jgi:hypothetical protein
MKNWNPPKFLDGTFVWDRMGYFFAESPPRNLIDDPDPSSSDPWMLIAETLERAKLGDHSGIRELAEYLRSDSPPLLLRGCVSLIADAGSKDDLETLAQMLFSQIPYLRLEAAWAIRTAGLVMFTPIVLEAWRQAPDSSQRNSLALCLSYLLDSVGGPIGSHEEYARDEYSLLVNDRFLEVMEKAEGPNVQAWRGKTWSVVELARYMLELAENQSERPSDLGVYFVGLRHRFEAATGLDCREFYHQRVFQPGAVVDCIESFLESDASAKFQAGIRYFFGHMVPNQ